MEKEIINGVESAQSQFKNKCSCGIDYKKEGMNYYDHLQKTHKNNSFMQAGI